MRRIWLILVIAMVAIAGCVAPGAEDDTGDGAPDATNNDNTGGSDVNAPDADDTDLDAHTLIMEAAEAAAESVSTPEAALAAGYRPAGPCVPGMGVHWIHKIGEEDSHFDAVLDETAPEVLLFLPDDGNLSDTSGDKFLGVEYVVVTEGTEMNATDAVPTLHGVNFYGPMEGHAPGEPWHAELHVYLAEGMRSDASFPQAMDAIACPPTEEAAEDDREVGNHTAVMAAARAAAENLTTPEAAWDAGYRPTGPCVPGMGVHWIHKIGEEDSLLDTTFNASAPEVLLFLPDDGNLSATANDTFLGIEYVVVTEGNAMNSTDTVPTFEGYKFYGPMEGHAPGEPWHAELHVYLADGSVSPEALPPALDTIQCPDGTTPPPQDNGEGEGDGHDHEH